MSDFFEIDGFDKFNQKLKLLPDKIKRSEILKIQRRVSKPLISAYAQNLPKSKSGHSRITKGGGTTIYKSGNLSRSVRIKTVSASKAGGNPMIAVLPDKKKGSDGYYRFMVVKKGFKGSGRGSRSGFNTVVGDARDKTAKNLNKKVLREAQIKTANYIQRQINKI
jgi:hypothetical protein